MPYAVRNTQGKIIALLKEAPQGNTTPINPSDPDVIEFLQHNHCTSTGPRTSNIPQRALADSDLEIVRVTEDIIQLLISKNIILFTELPNAVQRKLLNRKKLRTSMQPAVPNFLDESESI